MRGRGTAFAGLVRVGTGVIGPGGDGLADEMGFADPGALDVREDNGDGVAEGV